MKDMRGAVLIRCVLSPLSEHASDKQRVAYVWCASLLEVFLAKGLTAFAGQDSHGAEDHHADAPFWHLHPRGNGGVGIYHEQPDGSYDAHLADPEDLSGFLARLSVLQEYPSREQVWAAADAAADEAIAAALENKTQT